VIIFNSEALFDFIVDVTTKFSEPLIGILLCIFVGWIWNRNQLLNELKQGDVLIESRLFWKVWPNYVRYICPLVVLLVLIRGLTE